MFELMYNTPVSWAEGVVDAMDFLLDKIKHSKNNDDFFDSMNQ